MVSPRVWPSGSRRSARKAWSTSEEAEVDGFEAGRDEEQEDAPAVAHLLLVGVL